jgi:hypothetical protein
MQGAKIKIDNVDDLLVDILGVPDNAIAEEQWWLDTTKLFADAIAAAKDILVIDASSDRFNDGHPYLQICYEDDGAMTIEAVSSKFLDPGLSLDAQNTLAELGWQFTNEEKSPNYFQFLHTEEADPKIVAELFNRTFRTVYGITPSDTIEISMGKGIWPSESEEVEHE